MDPKNQQSSNIEDTKQFKKNLEKEEKDDKSKQIKEIRRPVSGWITKFRKRPGNEWLVEVDRDFLNDFTNFVALDEEISHMSQGLHVILSDGLYLDANGNSKIRSKTEGKYLEAAERLYGLVHVRYLLTNKGLNNILLRYKEKTYGVCPRHFCHKTTVLPIGMSDTIGEGNVKIYCPSCEDVYHSSLPQAPDGAFFGTSLPQMFFMAYPALHPCPTIGHYVARLHGFRIHGSANHVECEPKEATVKGQNKSNYRKLTSKPSRSKTKRIEPRDDLKENDAAQDNNLDRFPQINGHNPPEKTPRRRRLRQKKNIENVEVE